MDFKINLKLNEEFKKNMETYTGTKLATGYVEVNSAFKFPVSVFKKKDDSQMYVKYPDIQDDSGNSKNVVFPVDKELRESLNLAILAELKNNFLKGLDNPEIDSVTFERGKPITVSRLEMPIAGEMCQTLNDHWGYAKEDYIVLKLKQQTQFIG